MLRPSYTELMEILNDDADLDNKITSRYTIVIAAAKRARQIIDGADYDATGVATDKAVSIAVSEMYRGEIKILPEGSAEGFGEEPKTLYEAANREVSYRQAITTEGFSALDEEENGEFEEESGE